MIKSQKLNQTNPVFTIHMLGKRTNFIDDHEK